MKILFRNKDALNNNYKKIVIDSESAEIRVDISKKNPLVNTNTYNQSNKKLSSIEMVNKISAFFAYQNRINSISIEKLKSYNKLFYVFENKEEKKTIAHSYPRNNINRESIKLLTKKYIADRMTFLSENDNVEEIVIRMNPYYTKYKLVDDVITGNKRVELAIHKSGDKIDDIELQFLTDYLQNIILNSNANNVVLFKSYNKIIKKFTYELLIDGKTIVIPKEILALVCALLRERKKREENKHKTRKYIELKFTNGKKD